ncbi:Transposon Tn3 resolvase [Sporomusa ovata DSM 2662]|uniref:Site-specific recombinase n=1 Tax=Sporomusa ovata TaxID=2378 RepID=A0A0U1L6Z8_9FIRM|nr:recombinase family protein [Sporomusa ovata]EQB24702.1 site-specific recombinase, DNA invertase Pin [Sporomusa ovata DSM 2662]CQR75049.1 Site-specific recombinase [Sporomusa ovata]
MRVRIIEPIKSPELKRKRVCAYARVSTASDAQGESLENQTIYYQSLIESNPEYEYVGVFADQGITGTKGERPAFQEMLALAREQKIDLILTKSISRFARNTTIVLELVRELKNLDVEIVFEKENISTMNGDGEIMLTVLSSFAQEESKSASDNIKWRYRRKFEKGELAINATRFLGYDKDEYGDLVINPMQAEIVERIFNDYISGMGTFVIAKELNAEGVLTVAGGQWHPSTVLNILKNEKYKGAAKLQKTYIKDHLTKKKCINHGEVDSYFIEDNHSPIVTREMWEEAQQVMLQRAEAKGNMADAKEKYQNRYLLTGMLFCSKCGAPLRRRVWNSKYASKKIVWQCSTYIIEGKKSCPGTVIEDITVSKLTIKQKTVVEEVIKHGQKYYRYSGKS